MKYNINKKKGKVVYFVISTSYKLLMKNRINKKIKTKLFLISMFFGLILYISIYGIANLNVTYDAFIINDGADLPQHYLGAVFYRFAEWDGIGMFDTLTYPKATTILFTDSTPIMAIVTKVLSPLLPKVFQYCGIWGALCFMLQAGVASLILGLYTDSIGMIFLGEIPFLLSTPMLTKLFLHHAFGGQFIILLGIYFWFKNFDISDKKREDYIRWCLVGILCVLVNVYFIPMLGIIVVGYAISKVLVNKNQLFHGFACIATYIGGALASFSVLGGFSSDFQSDATYTDTYVDCLYRCGANLDTFINSYGIASIGPAWENAKDGQGEGLAYLGVGILALCIVTFYFFIKKKHDKWLFRRELVISIIVVFMLSLIVAIGPTLSWRQTVLCYIPYPKKLIELWATFRSTGRFIWIAYHLILVIVIGYFMTLDIKKGIKYAILIGCCYLQLIDLSPFLDSRNRIYGEYYDLNTEMTCDAWNYLGSNYRHAVVLPNSILTRSGYRYEIGKWAADNHITLNDFYLSRQKLEDQTQEYVDQILQGKVAFDTVYIFDIDTMQKVLSSQMHFYKIDNWYVGTLADISNEIAHIEIDKEATDLLQLQYIKDDLDYSFVFDAMYYYYTYADVQNMCRAEDVDTIFAHFLNVGMSEGRQATESFDPKAYKEFNGDLSDAYGNDWIQYYYHYMNIGRNEGRTCTKK